MPFWFLHSLINSKNCSIYLPSLLLELINRGIFVTKWLKKTLRRNTQGYQPSPGSVLIPRRNDLHPINPDATCLYFVPVSTCTHSTRQGHIGTLVFADTHSYFLNFMKSFKSFFFLKRWHCRRVSPALSTEARNKSSRQEANRFLQLYLIAKGIQAMHLRASIRSFVLFSGFSHSDQEGEYDHSIKHFLYAHNVSPYFYDNFTFKVGEMELCDPLGWVHHPIDNFH